MTSLSRSAGFWQSLLACLLLLSTGCRTPRLALEDRAEAMRLATDLRVSFAAATGASNRAVMAGSDDGAAAAAAEAREARGAAVAAAEQLRDVLRRLRYTRDLALLDEATKQVRQYAAFDEEVLALAIEGSNAQAQRLSFTDGRTAADAFVGAADSLARTNRDLSGVAAQAARAVREIQALQAPHIAEPDDAAMDALEVSMESSKEAARAATRTLAAAAATAERRALEAALERFLAVHDRILRLSRQNSNVRSLAMALGRNRAMAASCDEQLRGLASAIAAHEIAATR